MWGGLARIQGTAARNKSPAIQLVFRFFLLLVRMSFTRNKCMYFTISFLLKNDRDFWIPNSDGVQHFGYDSIDQIQGCAQPSLLSGCQAKML